MVDGGWPSTWNNCQYFKWTAGPDGKIADAAASITDLGGCYCINSSCGMGAHAQIKVANDAALGRVFGNADNYKDFLEKNLDKNVGQIDGEVKSYDGAQALGFQGNWRQFNAFRSEMQSLGDFTNAAAVNQVASKYGLSSGQALQMKAQFQTAKQFSESQEMSGKLGGSINAGAEMGKVIASESAGKVQGIYMSGGYDHYQTMASNDVTGRGARYDLVRGAADQMVGKIAPQLKSDPEMYQGGKLTDQGFAQMQKAMEGQNISFTTPDGRQTMNVGMDGNVVNSTEQGVVASGDKARAETLKQELKAGGFGKNAVAEVDRMTKSGKGFSYEFAKDRNGNVESFSISRGGDVSRKDMASFRVGRDAESVNRNVQTVDQGLRSTIGNQTWRGNRGITDNFHQDTYTDARGTHSRYSWTDKAGHKHIASGTPSTSFDLKSSLGTADERALLYWLLNRAWGIEGSTGPFNVLQGYADKDRFRALVNGYRERNHIDPSLAQKFADVLTRHVKNDKEASRTDFRSRFDSLCCSFARARKYENIPDVEKRERLKFVGEMRSLLAETCLAALEPDLIILDEFQRFKHLLDAESETSRLAHGLFDYADENSRARVLLLSATPYKMYTLSEESGEDDHYEDFMRTMRFLEPGNTPLFEKLVGNYRRELYRLGNGGSEMLEESKLGLEAQLRRIMVRTERLAATEDRDGMLAEVPPVNVTLETQDLDAYLGMQRITKVLDQGNALEYWKSAPYLLNFMDDYKLKQVFVDAISVPIKNDELADAIAASDNLLLPWDEIAKYHEIDPNNSRLRGLHADVIETGAWRLLWIPPALPYYRLEGPFADPALRKFTKRLVFSSWRMVPKVVATMLSYAVERRMISSFEEHPENSLDARKRRRPLLRFARTDERLTGMPLLGLLYPCTTLAKYCDPLLYDKNDDLPSLVEVLEWAQRIIEQLLANIKSGAEGTGPEDETWYWAAPILLDLQFDADLSKEWLRSPNLAGSWSDGTHDQQEGGEDESAWSAHVEYALKLANGELTLGRKPADLSLVLAQIAVAGPGVTALRSLARVTGGVNNITSVIKGYAGQVAWRFRSLFNLPEVTAFIRGLNREEPYWRRVVEYSAAGGLQSVLDEYIHTLRESLGLVDHAPEEIARQVASVMGESLSLRTSTLGVDEVVVNADSKTVRVEGKRMRGHFALRFGEEKNDDGAIITRAGQVRDAFNSPFWPFVLATTSVGQEGLDFHTYCHAVVHWNLPSNPVDMEQREGRVHRYKGHAVRKNLASHYGT